MKDLSNREWRDAIAADDNAIIIDVRTDDEIAEGYIKNAIFLDIHQPQSFMEGVTKIDKAANCYVYCRAGSRSSQACQIMEQLGFENTFNLTGGFSNWDGDIAQLKN